VFGDSNGKWRAFAEAQLKDNRFIFQEAAGKKASVSMALYLKTALLLSFFISLSKDNFRTNSFYTPLQLT
jgi:hypothetical protein